MVLRRVLFTVAITTAAALQAVPLGCRAAGGRLAGRARCLVAEEAEAEEGKRAWYEEGLDSLKPSALGITAEAFQPLTADEPTADAPATAAPSTPAAPFLRPSARARPCAR